MFRKKKTKKDDSVTTRIKELLLPYRLCKGKNSTKTRQLWACSTWRKAPKWCACSPGPHCAGCGWVVWGDSLPSVFLLWKIHSNVINFRPTSYQNLPKYPCPLTLYQGTWTALWMGDDMRTNRTCGGELAGELLRGISLQAGVHA